MTAIVLASASRIRATLLRNAGVSFTVDLVNGLVVIADGAEVWRYADSVSLLMRPLQPAFIDSYLKQVGEAALQSVGSYQLEGLGAQLFERVEGDYFSVLGLPLLPLLAFLRRRGIIPE